MKIAAFCLCLMLMMGWSSTDLYIEKAHKNKEHPGHCYTDTHGIGPMQKFERRQIIGKCEVAECRSNGDIAFARCSQAKIKEPCVIVEGNRSHPYPDCCFQIRCYFND